MNYRIWSVTLLASASVVGLGFSNAALAQSAPEPAGEAAEAAPAMPEPSGSEPMPTAPAATPTAVPQATGDIVDVASGNENFSTLVAAVQVAGLVDALKGKGPLTVFAPTNAAFEELPDGVVEALLKPENKDLLGQILKYHVVPGKVMAADLTTGKVETLNGGLAVKVTPERVIVNNGSVIQADVDASNGVIHAVSRVLLPMGVVAELQSRMSGSASSSAPIQALW